MLDDIDCVELHVIMDWRISRWSYLVNNQQNALDSPFLSSTKLFFLD